MDTKNTVTAERVEFLKGKILDMILDPDEKSFSEKAEKLYDFMSNECTLPEAGFLMITLSDSGLKWQERGPQTPSTWKTADTEGKFDPYTFQVNLCHKLVRTEGFRKWLDVRNSMTDDTGLFKKIMENPIDGKPYVWTKEDAEGAAAKLKELPSHWAFQKRN